MGIVRVLSMPFSGYDLMNAIQAAQHEHRPTGPGSHVAHVRGLRRQGRRGQDDARLQPRRRHGASARACASSLIDGNLQFGDLRALLRVPDQAPSVLQLPTDRISETDLEQVLWRDPSGIDILLAPPRVEMAEMVTVRDMEKTLSLLKRVYNVVVIDTPTLVNDMVLAFFDASDVIIELVTSDWTTMRNTRLMAHTFEAHRLPPTLRYVLNRAGAPGGIDPRSSPSSSAGARTSRCRATAVSWWRPTTRASRSSSPTHVPRSARTWCAWPMRLTPHPLPAGACGRGAGAAPRSPRGARIGESP